MTLPMLGTVVTLKKYPLIRDWICGPGHAVEIQDFCEIDMLEHHHSDLLSEWKKQLDGHHGPRGLHGPFFGLESRPRKPRPALSFRSECSRGLAVAEVFAAALMVIHSPLNH